MKYFLDALKNYAVFKGRASRKEFWMFALFGLFVIPICIRFLFSDWLEIIFHTGYCLFILIPTIAIMTRRIRDTGNNGALVILALIPFLGILIVLILCLLESKNINEFEPEFVENNKPERSQSENPNLHSTAAELDQTVLTTKEDAKSHEANENKGFGCAFASGGLFFGAFAGGIIGYIIGASQAGPSEAILAILYLIIGIPIGGIIGIAIGGILGNKRMS